MQTPQTAVRDGRISSHQLATQVNSHAPDLMVVMDHHAAKIYRIDVTSHAHAEHEIKPYDPHHLQHHLTHKNQSREAGQRTPEEYSFYEQIAQALAPAGRIVVIGHGAGKSNAAHHLIEHIRLHHHVVYQCIVHEAVADLSSTTPPQLLDIARKALT